MLLTVCLRCGVVVVCGVNSLAQLPDGCRRIEACWCVKDTYKAV
jgi:hypothetical protein